MNVTKSKHCPSARLASGLFLSVLFSALSGCASGPEVLQEVPPAIGTELYLRQPAAKVAASLPEAVRLSGLEYTSLEKVDKSTWEAVGMVEQNFGTGGQWTRIRLEEVTPDVSRLSAVSRLRYGGMYASLDTPPRTVLLHTLLLNTPGTDTSTLKPVVRPDLKLDLVRFQELARNAMAVKSPREWSAGVIGSNVALVAPIEGRGVLVAYTTMCMRGGNPHVRVARVTALALHNASTGKVIWKRDLNLGETVTLAGVFPRFVLMSAEGLTAFDPDSGRDAWTVKTNVLASAVDEEGKNLFVWKREQVGDNTEEWLTSIALDDGSTRWKVRMAEGADPGGRALFLHAGRLYAVGNGLAAYNTDNGVPASLEQTQWAPAARHIVVGGQLIIGDRSGALASIGQTGAARWKTSLPGSIELLSADGDELLVASATASGTKLSLLSLKDGSQRWIHEDQWLAGNPVFAGEVLAYSTWARLVVLDRTTGKELGAAPRSKVMQSARLPDRLVALDDRVVAMGETGMMAVSTGGANKAGSVLWRIDAHGTDYSTMAARQQQMRSAVYNGGLSPGEKEIALVQGANDARTAQLLLASLVPLADYQVAANKAQLETLIHPVPGGTGSNMSAGMRSSLVRANVEQGKAMAGMQFSMALLGASMGLAGQAVANLERIRGLFVSAQVERSQAAMRRASDLWGLSLQGNYYVRPIGWELGQGVLVVDYRTGHWTEVITGPGEPALQDFYTQYPAAMLSEDGRHLYTLAHSSEPAVAEFPIFAVPGRATAAFALPEKRLWHSPEDYARKSLAPRSIPEELIGAR